MSHDTYHVDTPTLQQPLTAILISLLLGRASRAGQALRLLVCAICLQGMAITPVAAATAPTSKPAATTATLAKSVAAARPDVNINKAGAAELAESLVGIGPAKAQAIIAWRTTHGSFKTLEDLGQVKGIGTATLAKNKAHIRF